MLRGGDRGVRTVITLELCRFEFREKIHHLLTAFI